MSLSHSAHIFCPDGKPPVEGGIGLSAGALTCFVSGVTDLYVGSSKHILLNWKLLC